MNWEMVGAIGEVFGAFAVILTLVYLARQLKQQNKIARYNAEQALYSMFIEGEIELSRTGGTGELIQRGLMTPDTLKEEESMRMGHFLTGAGIGHTRRLLSIPHLDAA